VILRELRPLAGIRNFNLPALVHQESPLDEPHPLRPQHS
jgi:hypothetical protein